jgi:transcription initiation factor IIE alpha subunit
MNDQNNVNETLKNIFSDAGLIDVICSLYEKHLTSTEIAKLVNLDNSTIEKHLKLLLDMNLIKTFSYNNTDSYTVINPKVCDSILMLKDALYRINTSNNVTT